jgi:WD40 repeat protein
LGTAYPCINTLKFTPDSRQLISGGHQMVPRNMTTIDFGADNVQRQEVRLWDVNTGKLVRDLVEVDIVGEGHLAFSPDGEHFATTDYHDLVHFWHIGEGSPRHAIRVPGSRLIAGFSPDGKTVAVPTGRGITFWDAQTAQRKFHEKPPNYSEIRCVAWSNRTGKLAIGYTSGVELWDAETGTLEHRFDMTAPGAQYAHTPGAVAVAFSVDGQLLVAAGPKSLRTWQRHGIVKAWDTTSGEQRAIIHVDRPVWTMSLADDGSIVAVTTGYGNPKDTQLSVFELPTGKLLSQYPKEIDSIPNNGKDGFERVRAARIPPGSTKVYMVCEDHFCFHWDFASHAVGVGFFADERTDGRACDIESAVFTPDAKTLVTSGDGKICVWNTETETLERMEVIPGITQWLELGISGDGRRLAGAEVRGLGREDAIRVWDLPSGKLKLKWQTPTARATSFAFSTDNTKLLTGLDRGTAVVWDVRVTGLETQHDGPNLPIVSPLSKDQFHEEASLLLLDE